jgi:hypothetical protein
MHLRLLAAVNANQQTLFIDNLGRIEDWALPLSLRIDEERMRITHVDVFRSQVTVERSQGVPHSVTADVVIAGESEPPPITEAIQRVPGGWYSDGYVFDDAGRQVCCLIYSRHGRQGRDGREGLVVQNLRPFSERQHRGSGNEKLAWISLETVPADVVVVTSPLSLSVQIRGYDGGFVPGGIHDQFVIEPSDLRTVPVTSHLRCDGEDISFVVDQVAYHLRVLRVDTFFCDIPTPQRFALVQSATLLDELLINTSYEFLDGPKTHPVRTSSCIHNSADPRRALEEDAKQFLLERFNGRGPSIEHFKQKLTEYATASCKEFEQTVGRAPRGVPIPLRIQAEMQWALPGIRRDLLSYFVWVEWPEQELVQLLFEDVLAEQQRTELERKRREIREREDRERRRLAEERERLRLEQERLRLAAERARMERRRKALADSFVVRGRMAGTLCIASVMGFLLMFVRAKRGAAK